jgi:hypothetical protein
MVGRNKGRLMTRRDWLHALTALGMLVLAGAGWLLLVLG